MDLYREILIGILSNPEVQIQIVGFDMDKLIDSVDLTNLHALRRIKAAVEDESLSDFACVEEIVCILESIGSGGGFRHDCAIKEDPFR